MANFVLDNTPLPPLKSDAHPPINPAIEVDAADINNLWAALGDVRTVLVTEQPVTYVAPFTGAVSRTIPSKLAETVSVVDFGAKGDGVTDDTAALVAAKTAAGTSKTLVINVKARIAGAVGTISGPLRFEGNGAFDLTAGGSVSLSGSIDAPVSQIFFTAPLTRPTNATFTTGVGTLVTGTYYYRVTALNAQGESFPSMETSLTITGPAGINVNWSAVTGATGYKVYGRATLGAEALLATLGTVTTWLDDGSVTPNGVISVTDKTSGLTFSGKVPEVLPEWWGAKVTSDDTMALQSALWAGQNGTVKLSSSYRVTSPLIPPQNSRMVGKGPLFSGGITADGCTVMQVYGTNQAGGWAFRVYLANLTFQFTNIPNGAKLFDINQAYSVDLDHVRFDNTPDQTTAVSVIGSNDVNLRKLLVYGVIGGVNHAGVFVQGVGTGLCIVKLIEPDLESLHYGVQAYGGATVDIVSIYAERDTVAVDNQTASGKVNLFGGHISGANSGTFCVRAMLAGGHTTILGTRLIPGSGINTLYAAVSGANIFWQDDATGYIYSGVTTGAGVVSAATLVPQPSFGTAAPTTGQHYVGEKVFNSAPAVGSPKGWVCTVSGTPGTWVSEGNL